MRNTLRKFKNNYLSLSANIRNGMLILLILIGLCLLIPVFYSSFIHKTPQPFTKEEIKLYDSILGSISKDTTPKMVTEQKLPTIRTFDPNKISFQEWIEFGVSEKIANRISHYIEKGGRFRVSGDVLKIYGFDTSIFRQLEPYMVFPNKTLNAVNAKTAWSNERKPESKYIPKQKPMPKLEINGADSAELTKLYGIGPAFASRIMKYRNLLGGFYTLGQLKEVYGINDSIFQVINNQLIIDSSKIAKMNLKTHQFIQLQKHPYIGRYKARLIEKLIKSGYNASKKELIENNIFTENEYLKIQPYLK